MLPSKKNYPHYSNELINKIKKTLRSGKVNYWTGQEGKSF